MISHSCMYTVTWQNSLPFGNGHFVVVNYFVMTTVEFVYDDVKLGTTNHTKKGT